MACATCKQARRDLMAAASAITHGNVRMAGQKLAVVARVVGEKVHWSPARQPGGKRRS